MSKFCLCIDLDGFYINGTFVVREMGWYSPVPEWGAYGVQHYTHDYQWSDLSERDQKKVRFVKRRVTGLTFRPSPQEYKLQQGSLPGQSSLRQHVQHLWNKYKTDKCDVVAYKGGKLEHSLLTLLDIPSIDIEKHGCPKFDILKSEFDYPRCSCHHVDDCHCSMSECFVFSQWMLLNKM